MFIYGALTQLARVSALHAEGRQFKSDMFQIYGPGEVWHLTSFAQRNESSSMLPVSTYTKTICGVKELLRSPP